MEGLLTPVSTAYKNIKEVQEDALVEVQKLPEASPRLEFQATSPAEALKVLQNEPDFSNLVSILKYLDTTNAISLSSPSPLGSQLINILVSDITTNYWAVFSEKDVGRKGFKHSKERDLLLRSLRNVAGLGAILARLRALIDQSKVATKNDGGRDLAEVLKDYLDVLEATLQGKTMIKDLWAKLQIEPIPKQLALWREVTALVGGGRLLNAAAEAHSIVNESSKSIGEIVWIADAVKYSHWLANNIQYWATHLALESDTPWKYCSELLSRSLRLGHPGTKIYFILSHIQAKIRIDIIIGGVLDLLLGADGDSKALKKLMGIMPTLEQKSVLNSALRLLVRRYVSDDPNHDNPDWWQEDVAVVSAAAAYLNALLDGNATRKEMLLSWLTSLSGAGIGEAIGIRRAAIAVFSQSKYDLESILEKSMQQFGDQLYIKHTPSLQQDGTLRLLLF